MGVVCNNENDLYNTMEIGTLQSVGAVAKNKMWLFSQQLGKRWVRNIE